MKGGGGGHDCILNRERSDGARKVRRAYFKDMYSSKVINGEPKNIGRARGRQMQRPLWSESERARCRHEGGTVGGAKAKQKVPAREKGVLVGAVNHDLARRACKPPPPRARAGRGKAGIHRSEERKPISPQQRANNDANRGGGQGEGLYSCASLLGLAGISRRLR